MTILAHGNRLDALARFEELVPHEFVYIEDAGETGQVQLAMRWRTPSRELKHLVFIVPKALKPSKSLKPRADRHLVFDELTAPWKRWSQQPGVEVEDHCVDTEKLEQLLRQGSVAAGVPVFTAGAAEHFINVHPGGLTALQGPLAMLKASEVKTPIELTSVRHQWPFRVIAGKVYSVDLMTLVRKLGSQEAMVMVKDIVDKEAYGALKGVEVVCARKIKGQLRTELDLLDLDTGEEPVKSWLEQTTAKDLADRFAMIRARSGSSKIPCFVELERLQLVQVVLSAIEQKRLRPKAALFLVCLRLYQESRCPSKSQTELSVSKLLSTDCLLSSTPS